jgi:hypothetical protein
VVAPHLVRELGFESLLYLSLFDEGWPLLPKKERAFSGTGGTVICKIM